MGRRPRRECMNRHNFVLRAPADHDQQAGVGNPVANVVDGALAMAGELVRGNHGEGGLCGPGEWGGIVPIECADDQGGARLWQRQLL